MALLEEMAAQRNAMLQLQSWKEPDPSSSSKKRHIVNVLWNNKVRPAPASDPCPLLSLSPPG